MNKTKTTPGKLSEMIEFSKLHNHLCLIYEIKEEQSAPLIPFIKISSVKNKKCVYIPLFSSSSASLRQLMPNETEADKAIVLNALAPI